MLHLGPYSSRRRRIRSGAPGIVKVISTDARPASTAATACAKASSAELPRSTPMTVPVGKSWSSMVSPNPFEARPDADSRVASGGRVCFEFKDCVGHVIKDVLFGRRERDGGFQLQCAHS